jgi:TetR/AcrR family transcriptional regulator, transcriptional repressor for nem operon
MKVTKEKMAQNRRALVRAASKLFRKHGINGVAVADIGKEAGLTHGAVYAQFPSKQVLAAEALSDALERSHERMAGCVKDRAATIGDYLDFFINSHHRDNIVEGCAMAASGSEIARQGKNLSRAFAHGFDRMAHTIETSLKKAPFSATARERALAVAAASIGAIIVSRGVAKADPALSEEILTASRRVLGAVGGEF